MALLAKNEFFRSLSVELVVWAFADRCRMIKSVDESCLWLVGLVVFHEHTKCQCDECCGLASGVGTFRATTCECCNVVL